MKKLKFIHGKMKFKLHASKGLEDENGQLIVKGLLDPSLREVVGEDATKVWVSIFMWQTYTRACTDSIRVHNNMACVPCYTCACIQLGTCCTYIGGYYCLSVLRD